MHELRSAIASGEGLRPNGPIASKKRKAVPVGGSLTAIAVKREESRLTNQRREERHRNILESATIHFRRRKYDVPVVNVSSGGVMVESSIEPRIGEALDIQFSDCNRTKCVVRWIRENRIGLEFNHETTIIGPASIQDFIIRRLRGDKAAEEAGVADAQAKRAPRHNLIWIGTLHCNHDSIPVRLRNISTDGAMLETEHLFPVGTEVLLDLEEAGTAFSKVRWAKGGQIGLKFDQKFNLQNLMKCSPTAASVQSKGKATTYMVKPRYLETEKSPTSPWAAMWDKFSPEDIKSGREF